MDDQQKSKTSVVAVDKLPTHFPTHLHAAEFWEALGRAVATFGFLEEVLGKAIYSFTATTEYSEADVADAYKKWLPTLERALSDPLGGLISSYDKAVRENQKASGISITKLVEDLQKASRLRNVLCHGSWRRPDDNGRSMPWFVNNKMEVFDTPIDLAWLNQIQRHVAELACDVVSTVTSMGWQFPGSESPGSSIR